ncbi:MAG: methyltransferase domain-containing protein [Smithellaceae bacterium]|nr:methyltransferase domain-containing protein [Smithellaceae bacterium]
MKNNFTTQNAIRRFDFFSYPLESYNDSDCLHRADYRIQGKTYIKPLYPIRAMTYWWVTHVLREEIRRLHSTLVIADIGCERGLLKRFVPLEIKKTGSSYWIGMDMRKDQDMDMAGYDEFHICDFNKGLSLENKQVNVVALLNVIEHLQQPEFIMTEIMRILKLQGVALIALPVYPKLIAKIRERQYISEFNKGQRKYGNHTVAFWPNRIIELALSVGFRIEFSASTYFMSWSKGPLENYKLWIRFNQLWGALFPSLGQEFCLKLRKV